MYCKLFINPLRSYRKFVISSVKQKSRFIPNSGFNRFYVSHKNNFPEEITKSDYIKWYANPRYNPKIRKDSLSSAYYLAGLTIFMIGMGFSAVPLYEKFCKVTNYGGSITIDVDASYTKAKDLKRIDDRELTILFNADKNARLQWNFKPLQTSIQVVPGETVLAFYTAENPTEKAISGISTYNIVPYEAAQYFNKIQCFCFDEQQLNPHEQVDMPIFFFIDPDFINDPNMVNVDVITLSYTFFEAKEGLNLPFMPKF